MSTALFTFEWQALSEIRGKWTERITELKIKLRNLSTEPDFKSLLREKESLRKRAATLQHDIKKQKEVINIMHQLIIDRKASLTNRTIKQQCDYTTNERRRCVAYLKRENAARERIEKHERLLWELEAPIEEVERVFDQKIPEEEQVLKTLEDAFEHALIRITEIKEAYTRARTQLQEEIGVMEARLPQLKMEELEWATQDIDHLHWALEQNVFNDRNRLIRHYQAKFPDQNVSGLLSRETAAVRPTHHLKGKRRRTRVNIEPSPDGAQIDLPPTPDAWRFFITFNPSQLGQELPNECKQFVENLTLILDKADYHSLNAWLVYEKLLLVTGMTVQQRQHLKLANKPHGWKMLNVSKDYVLFLWIDEKKWHIQFMLSHKR